MELWYKKILDDKKRNMIIEEFCANQLLSLSFTKEEIIEKLKGWKNYSLYNQLIFITDSSTEGPAAIRQRENGSWANQIKEAGRIPNIDVVVVFVGKAHLDSTDGRDDKGDSVKLPGLKELFEEDQGPFQKVYAASNYAEDSVTSDVPNDPSGGSTSSEKSSSEEDTSSSDSYSDTSSENEHPFNEEIRIKEMTESIKSSGIIVPHCETNTESLSRVP